MKVNPTQKIKTNNLPPTGSKLANNTKLFKRTLLLSEVGNRKPDRRPPFGLPSPQGCAKLKAAEPSCEMLVAVIREVKTLNKEEPPEALLPYSSVPPSPIISCFRRNGRQTVWCLCLVTCRKGGPVHAGKIIFHSIEGKSN